MMMIIEAVAVMMRLAAAKYACWVDDVTKRRPWSDGVC